MNTAFAELINREIDEDIQNSPFIAILADGSVDITVYKKLDIYIRLVKDNKPCSWFVGNHNMPDGKAETIIILCSYEFHGRENIDCGTKKKYRLWNSTCGIREWWHGCHDGVSQWCGCMTEVSSSILIHTHCEYRLALCTAQAAKSAKLLGDKPF